MNRVIDAFAVPRAPTPGTSPARPRGSSARAATAVDYDQAMDIVDVWFESGSTHAFVLAPRNLPFPADLYLEGSDQHRGWFQSSLLEAIGTRGQAPFKAILTHGFVLDEQGRKMSKSVGNTTEPQTVLKEYGADILRLWVMNSDTTQDLRIGKEILKQQAEIYRRIRNTWRWLLGSLEGFTPSRSRALRRTAGARTLGAASPQSEFDARFRRAARDHDWAGLIPDLHGFCNNDLSAFYFDVRKDALYCDAAVDASAAAPPAPYSTTCIAASPPGSPRCCASPPRRPGWRASPGDDSSVHLELWPDIPAAWRDEALAERWARIRGIRGVVTGALEAARREGVIGASLQAEPRLTLAMEDMPLLDAAGWAEICITSSLDLGAGNPAISIEPAPGQKCDRCWRVLSEVSPATALCMRCTAVVGA